MTTPRTDGVHSPDDRRFVGLAAAAIDDYLVRNPVAATRTGDQRFDSRLPDWTADGVAEQVRVLNRHLLALDALDPLGLSRVNHVDLGVLRRALAAHVHRLAVLEEPRWNPLWWSPAAAFEPLLARPDPPVRTIAARLRALPDFLDSARHTLEAMPRPHTALAIAHTAAMPALLAAGTAPLFDRVPAAAAELQDALTTADEALADHHDWLRRALPGTTADHRLGARPYADALGEVYGVRISPERIKREALEELERLEDEVRRAASAVLRRSLASRRLVPDALAAVAEQQALPGGDLIAAAQRALVAARQFCAERGIVDGADVAMAVGPLPAALAGDAVARCEPPGPLGADGVTRILLAGPDEGWPAARRSSYLREYHVAMVDALMAHEGVPGNALAHHAARGAAAPTAVRAVFPDALFTKGWAGYAGQLLLQAGYGGSAQDPAAFRLAQLKMRSRSVVNAVLDISFHTEGLDEPSARRLLATTGLAEEGEVVAKWRRVQVSYGSLITTFLGTRAVTAVAQEVRAARPGWGQARIHEAVLAHGAVPVPALRELLDLP
jgi:uncharacterized protein (DUF885 family)